MKQVIIAAAALLFSFNSFANASIKKDERSTEKVYYKQGEVIGKSINFEFDKTVDKSYTLEIYNFIGRKMASSLVTELKMTVYFNDAYYKGLYIFQLRDRSGRIIESGKFQVIR